MDENWFLAAKLANAADFSFVRALDDGCLIYAPEALTIHFPKYSELSPACLNSLYSILGTKDIISAEDVRFEYAVFLEAAALQMLRDNNIVAGGEAIEFTIPMEIVERSLQVGPQNRDVKFVNTTFVFPPVDKLPEDCQLAIRRLLEIPAGQEITEDHYARARFAFTTAYKLYESPDPEITQEISGEDVIRAVLANKRTLPGIFRPLTDVGSATAEPSSTPEVGIE